MASKARQNADKDIVDVREVEEIVVDTIEDDEDIKEIITGVVNETIPNSEISGGSF